MKILLFFLFAGTALSQETTLSIRHYDHPAIPNYVVSEITVSNVQPKAYYYLWHNTYGQPLQFWQVERIFIGTNLVQTVTVENTNTFDWRFFKVSKIASGNGANNGRDAR